MPVKHVSTSWAVTGRLVRNEPDVVFGGFQAKVGLQKFMIIERTYRGYDDWNFSLDEKIA